MKITKYKSNEDWLEGRLGQVTGTRLKDLMVNLTKEMIVSELTARGVEFKKTDRKEELEKLLTKEDVVKLLSKVPKKKGFYEIVAERVALPPDDENRMARGHRLEEYGIDRLEKETGLVFNRDLVIFRRDDNEHIAYSPDGYVEAEVITVEAEVKCLNSASHCEAYLTGEIPSEYTYQKIQAFVVNENLQTLYFVFYDPRMPKDFFYFTVTRESLANEIEEALAIERMSLIQIAEAEEKLTF